MVHLLFSNREIFELLFFKRGVSFVSLHTEPLVFTSDLPLALPKEKKVNR